MRQLILVVFAAGVLAALGCGRPGVQQAEVEGSSLKDQMRKTHKGPESPLSRVDEEIDADPPHWEAAQAMTKELVMLGTTLVSTPVPRGDKEHWSQLTHAYLETAKSMAASAQKKDKDAFLSARDQLKQSCKPCHDAHGHE